MLPDSSPDRKLTAVQTEGLCLDSDEKSVSEMKMIFYLLEDPYVKVSQTLVWVGLSLARNSWFPSDSLKERDTLPPRFGLQSIEKLSTFWIFLTDGHTQPAQARSLVGMQQASETNRRAHSSRKHLFWKESRQHADHLGYHSRGSRSLQVFVFLLRTLIFPKDTFASPLQLPRKFLSLVNCG